MQPSGAECAFHPIYDARALAQQVFPLAVGAPRVLLGWGFRAQEADKRMKDKASHTCHALRRAGVADELQRAGNALRRALADGAHAPTASGKTCWASARAS